MRRRWTLFARLAALFALTLFGLQLGLLAIHLATRTSGDERAGHRFPLPQRAVAIAELIEVAPEAGRVLAAVNSEELRVFVAPEPIDAFEAEPLRLPAAEAILGRYAERLGPRGYAAFLDAPHDVAPSDLWFAEATLWSRHPMRLALALDDGRTLVMESRGDLLTQVTGLPLGFATGLVSFAGAGLVLLMLRRETRPLVGLAEAMRRFGRTGTPQPVTPAHALELDALVTEFDRMQHRIAGLVRDRTVMLGALGHDLRTYLTRLRLRVEGLGPEGAAMTPTLDRMAAVTENCLALARDAGDTGPLDVLDLRAAVIRAIDGRTGATLGPMPEVEILFDEVALRRVLDNLVDNALRFGTRCKIAATVELDRVRLTVDDDGPGIPAAEREIAFEPFRRPDAARTLGEEGTGLGLAIVRLLAGRNGATVWLGDVKPSGLRVGLDLQRA